MATERTGRGGRGERGERDDRADPSRWEWVVAALGAALVLGVIGYMVYVGVTAPDAPHPRIRLAVDTVFAHASGYTVEFRAENEGDATAAGLVVRGRLLADTGAVDESEVVIDFVPAKSRRRAALVFAEDPRVHRLELRPLGYDRP
ncbi:MAG TPA: hypothetical protein VNA89_06325 [Gemmatimonadaceae bacterium]|nr:hypothetical protein [Gemmatimonadaceae bacterium]